ncbi:MAG: carboxypeptidase-like regulatory domain-containing protein [Pseudomonadota bacterium]
MTPRTLVTLSCLSLPLLGCAPNDDTAAEVPTTLSGTVLDRYTREPVDGAWVWVDDGGVVTSTRSAADGSYLFEDLPTDRSVTVAAFTEDAMAVTWSGWSLAEHGATLDLVTQQHTYANGAFDMEVSGSISGLPQDCDVSFYGEEGYVGFLEVEEATTRDFSFVADIRDGDDVWYLTALATDRTTGTVLGVAWGSVPDDPGGSARLDLVMGEPLSSGTLNADLPAYDGDVFDDAPTDCSSGAQVHDPLAWGTVLGVPTGCELTADAFRVDYSWLPLPSHGERALVSFTDTTHRYQSLAEHSMPEDGGEEIMDIMDPPVVDGGPDAELNPAQPLSWAPVDGARYYWVYVTSGARRLWRITPLGGTEASIPALPEGLDMATIGEQGSWSLWASTHHDIEDLADGTFLRQAGISGGRVDLR